ncbi:MAG: hypothetical protein K2M64_03530 [Clostridia bacterium]|nr:hypothetical protein [Clostridia bacterium]
MKKTLIIILALVMALSVVGLVSCAGKTYEGEYKYENPYAPGNYYGAKVKVTVQGNVITNVVLLPDSESGLTNLSPNWTTDGYNYDFNAAEAAHDTEGKTNWRKYGQAMVDSFVGLTVDEVLGIKVYVNLNGEPYTASDYSIETIKYLPEQLAVVMNGYTVGDGVTLGKGAGATQSSSRVILAVQDALLKSQGKETNPNCVTLDLGTDATAYGLVHGQGYVGIATVTVKYGKISKATLDEACFPTQVKATADAGDYAVANGSNYFWKTVKYGNVTMTYEAGEEYKGYKVGNQTLVEFFQDAANCKAYAEAVMANKVTVVTADGEKTDIMTAQTLLKSNNGYWTVNETSTQLGWKANVTATCNYVVTYGFAGVTSSEDLKTEDHSATNAKLDNEFVDKNGVATGATWTDMWDYVNLLHTAYATLVG